MIVLNAILLFFAGFFWFVCMLFVIFPLFILNYTLKDGERKDKIKTFFKRATVKITAVVLGFYFNKPILISCKKNFKFDNRNLIVSNHLTEYDWWFFIAFLWHHKQFDTLYFIMKKEIESYPIVGWCLKTWNNIFLIRKLSENKEIFLQKLSYIGKKEAFNLGIFPEGTVIEKATREKSVAYAEKNEIYFGGKKFCQDRVLLPRTTGVKLILDTIPHFENIIDFTIGSVPYEREPYNSTLIYDVFLKRKRDFQLFFMVDKHKNSPQLNNDDYIFGLFNRKNKILEAVEKEKDLNLSSISKIHKKFSEEEDDEYETFKVKIWSNWYYLYFILFYFIFIMIVITCFNPANTTFFSNIIEFKNSTITEML